MSDVQDIKHHPIYVLAPRALNVVGAIIILATFLDLVIALFSADFTNTQWMVTFITQLVERGGNPLIGIAFILAGSWLTHSTRGDSRTHSALTDSKFWALLLACLLGLVFILVVPLHLHNVGQGKAQGLEEIDERATQLRTQLEGQLSAGVNQQLNQLGALLQNEEQLNAAIESGQISQDQATLFQQFREDPQALEEFVQERTGQSRQGIENQVDAEIDRATEELNSQARISSIRISLNSLLLALGYIVIGWTGVKSLVMTR